MGNVSSSACRRIVPLRRVICRLLLMAACGVATAAQAAPVSTTTLTLSSSTVASHTQVILTASVDSRRCCGHNRLDHLLAIYQAPTLAAKTRLWWAGHS